MLDANLIQRSNRACDSEKSRIHAGLRTECRSFGGPCISGMVEFNISMQCATAERFSVRDGAGFESTHWTVVLEATVQDSAAGQAAFAVLYQTYWYPLYAFIRRSGHSPDEAQDLTQGFFANLLEKKWLSSISREGGKFRSYLLGSVKHFLSHCREQARAQKRGGGKAPLSLDCDASELRYQLEQVDNLTPERVFEQRWAWQMLEQAIERLRREYVRAEKGELFEELKIFLSGAQPAVSHAELAAKYEISTSAVGVAIHRMRRRYGELLRQEIARTVNDPREVDDEIRQLIACLRGELGR
jgi:DNA-directed RNA polymerase specialized sigma24 family protein